MLGNVAKTIFLEHTTMRNEANRHLLCSYLLICIVLVLALLLPGASGQFGNVNKWRDYQQKLKQQEKEAAQGANGDNQQTFQQLPLVSKPLDKDKEREKAEKERERLERERERIERERERQREKVSRYREEEEKVRPDYWERHGVMLLIFLTMFPRLTLLFATEFLSYAGFGLWIGWLISPRTYLAKIIFRISL